MGARGPDPHFEEQNRRAIRHLNRAATFKRRAWKLGISLAVCALLLAPLAWVLGPKLLHPPWTDAVAFSPDGHLLAAYSSSEGTIRLWDLQNGRLLRMLANPGDPPLRHDSSLPVGSLNHGLAFSPDGRFLAAVANQQVQNNGAVLYTGLVRVWDTQRWTVLHSLPMPGEAFSVAFSPSNTALAVGLGFGEAKNPPPVQLWAVPGWQFLRSMGLPGGLVFSLAFSADGRTLIAEDVGATLYEVASGHVLQTIPSNEMQDIALSPDGRVLAVALLHENDSAQGYTGQGETSIVLYDLTTGQRLRTLTHQDGMLTSVAFWSLAFSPDGRVLATGSANHQITLWNVAHGTLLRTLSGHSSDVFALAFSPDGRMLVSGSQDRSWMLWADQTVKVWDVATGGEGRTLSG
ncbi:MAG TPA: WD40 repeat domain-containing protein [Ktedonobacterales bacterium]|nr:WD40 repeat domain-containing protein [Ktedonobacterales bacterium]